MPDFILQHRRNDTTIYESIDAAKEVIEPLDGQDGEIIVIRFYDDNTVKSAMAICKKTASDAKATWTYFSYDDLSIDKVIPNFWKGTLEDYNKITDKDDGCIYFVVGDTSDDE